MSTPPTILLVGHCRPDFSMLRSAITSMCPGANVKAINDSGALDAGIGDAALLLINRVLDGDFVQHTGTSRDKDPDGLALISALAVRDDHRARLMLVSNFDDAQREAVARGALPGFGKKDLYSGVLRDALASVLPTPGS